MYPTFQSPFGDRGFRHWMHMSRHDGPGGPDRDGRHDHDRHDHDRGGPRRFGPPLPPPGPGPRGFGRGGRGPFGRGRRVGRGDVRAAILSLLGEAPMHGYQIMQELAERSGGAWRPSPGSVYPTLQALEDEELITAGAEGGKRTFTLTAAGRAVLDANPDYSNWVQTLGGTDDGIAELRDLLFQVGAAAHQVMHAGSARQIAAAKALLTETRRQLYQLLAEDDTPPPPEPAPRKLG